MEKVEGVKRKKSKKYKTAAVYQFDKDKKLVGKYESSLSAADALGWSKYKITNAIANQRLCDGQWYFSRSEEWVELPKGINPQAARRIIRFFGLREKV